MIQTFQERTLSIYTLPSTKDVITYLHAALGFPTKETLLAATRAGFLTSWPGMTVTAINKHFPESIETQKGHMKHQRQGVRSTKVPQLQPGVTEQERTKLETELKILKQKHGHLLPRVRRKRDRVQRPNRKIPDHIQQGKQVSHGIVLHGWQLHHDGTNEIKT